MRGLIWYNYWGQVNLLSAIRAVVDGQSLLDPSVTGKIMERLVSLTAKEERRVVNDLFEREAEVLALVAKGLTNKEIAESLVISDNTARNHVSRILEKLGLPRRSEAAAFAAQHGLLEDEKRT